MYTTQAEAQDVITDDLVVPEKGKKKLSSVKSFPPHFRISISTCHHSTTSFRLLKKGFFCFSFSPAAGNPFFFVFIAKTPAAG